MDHKEQDKLIAKSVAWGVRFADAVSSVGGYPGSVLAKFSQESITTMVRNGLDVAPTEKDGK